MIRKTSVSLLTLALLALASSPASADDYTLDPAHTGANFKVSHLGLSWTYGRFNDVSGDFSIAEDPEKCSFKLTIKTESIDTGNAKRDEHLRSPDFFNVKQFPEITFQTTAVKGIKDGYEVTGELTMHGTTKSLTFNLLGGRKREFPKPGMLRTGFSTELVLKRSQFGMEKMTEFIGDDIRISISFEGTKK